MRIQTISFNIRCCDDPDGNSIAERAPRLATIISRYKADIIGFQEVRTKWEPYLERYYAQDYEMFLKYRNLTVDMEASPILWRRDKFELVKDGYFWFSDTPEVESRGWDELYNCYRMCVYVILKEKSSEKLFTVMNTHFGFGDQGQTKSAELLYRYSKQVSDYPTFVIGDFNMTPTTKGYEVMTRNFRDVNACTVKDTQTTFHKYDPEAVNNCHIDYCFIDDSITPIDYKIITDTIDGKYPSDHYGLHIALDI